jgi:hypothetical protein
MHCQALLQRFAPCLFIAFLWFLDGLGAPLKKLGALRLAEFHGLGLKTVDRRHGANSPGWFSSQYKSESMCYIRT